MAWELLEHEALRWLHVPTLFNQLSFAFGDGRREEALASLSRSQALVLDDIDKARGTEYAAGELLCAIDNCVTAGAALIVTTNLGLDALAEKFPSPSGYAIASRLAQHCKAFALEGQDRRLARFVA